jgi:hypothetical protein
MAARADSTMPPSTRVEANQPGGAAAVAHGLHEVAARERRAPRALVHRAGCCGVTASSSRRAPKRLDRGDGAAGGGATSSSASGSQDESGVSATKLRACNPNEHMAAASVREVCDANACV